MNVIRINQSDAFYPVKLKEICDPPEEIYCVGDIRLLNEPSIAIVGARDASDYGRRISKKLSSDLSKRGVTIISGLAKGIDSCAHEGAYDKIGKTIAVLGCGIDIIYPKENEELYKNIIRSGGLIISEFPLGTKPEKDNFPKRNRLISGLSNGVVVVEAKAKSGALITVDCALEQGKNVFAVPGNIGSIYSEGTNNLIKDGAIPVTSYEDILLHIKIQNGIIN
ncbi:MAG: DNA-processing protein DprA [Clostridia bacterium]|nr:DNA-processing protein DprA [Clostridia bacterium]